MDHVDDALQPLRDSWAAQETLSESDDAYTAALSAGVAFVGAIAIDIG